MNDRPAYLFGAVTSTINAAAIAVHKELGPGFLESIYEEALCVEFDRRKVAYERQVPIRIRYQGVPVGLYRLDLIVDRKVVVEIKAVDAIHEAHLAVALAYLKATGLRVGLIVNFADAVMRSRRVFREVHGVNEEQNFGKKERQEGVLLTPNIGHKDVPHDGERALQDSQLGGLQSEPD
jgi:GxxExxY protein